MDVTIGVRNTARELSISLDSSAEDLYREIEAAQANGNALRLTDTEGHTLIVPIEALGYVEVAATAPRRVGFGLPSA